MNKQKVLLPSLKEGHRYMVYEIKLAKMANFERAHNSIISQCNSMLGIFDGADAGLMSAKYNPKTSRGIIRVNNRYTDKLKICLGMITNIENKDVIVDCIYVSGMMNKAVARMDA